MAREDCPQRIGSTFTAAGDLSSDQWKAVYQSAAGQVSLSSVAGDPAIGILYNAPSASGQPADVVVGGVTPAMAGAAFAYGAKLTPDATGRLVTASDDDYVMAEAAAAASAAGDIVSVLVQQTGKGSQPLRLTDSGAGVTLKTFVKLDSSGEGLTATEGDQAIGVAKATVSAAGTIEVQVSGSVLVTAGETIVAGDYVAPFSTTGRAGKVDTIGLAAGIALTGAAAASDITVLLLPLGVQDFIILATAADYSADGAGKLVDIDSSGEAVIVSAIGAKYVGSIVSASATEAIVRVTKVVKVLSGAVFTMGDKLSSDASAKAITAVSGQYAGAIALESASGADELKKALLISGIPAAGAWHCLCLSGDGGLVGSSTLIEDMEFPVAMTTRRAYGTVSVAPGSGKVVTVTIGTKTMTISGTATTGENEALDEAIAANTDFDVSVVDDGVAEDLQVVIWVQETLAT